MRAKQRVSVPADESSVRVIARKPVSWLRSFVERWMAKRSE